MPVDIHTPKHEANSSRPLKGRTVGVACREHGYTQGDHCPKCVTEVRSGPNVIIFKPMWYTDICDKPLYIESKRQLRDECKKHNVKAVRLM